MTPQWIRRAAVAALAAAGLALTAAAPATAQPARTAQSTAHQAPVVSTREMPAPPDAQTAIAELGELTVAEPHSMDGYSRSKFPHWITQSGTCDTRETVLMRDGADVETDAQCRAVSGSWHSEYDGKDFSKAGQLDIDHMVPLAAAWRAGADEWTTPERQAFANDLTHSQLIAVSAASNRSKADKDPSTWRPPLQSYWCTYAEAWTDTKHVYHLNITQPEHDALAEMLATC